MVFTRAAVAALAVLAICADASAITPRQKNLKFPFGQQKVRGVNLGGWFVLEPWITPSIFDATPDSVVDEFTFGQVLGKAEASRRLQQHWATWITEADFAEMASRGLNFVRIPIGYWSVLPRAQDPYVQGAYDYMRKAVDWAQAHNIKVMIDVHGAPESQNGFDNSGKRGGIGWMQGDTTQHQIMTVRKIRDDFANHPAVAAIQPVNEPMGPSLNQGALKQFYMDTWGDLRDSPVAFTFHDAFLGVNSWNDWGSGMWALMLDTHHYEVFDNGQLQMGIQQHLDSACGFGRQMTYNNKWTIAGEWTGAMTDCARWLNGRGVGARYDGTFFKDGQGSSKIGSCDAKYQGTVAGFGEADHNNIKSFIAAQMSAYEKAAGWIFWTWKNEAAPEWHFQNLTREGLVPQPFDSARGC